MKWIVALAALLTAAPAVPQTHNTAISTAFPPPRFHAGQTVSLTFLLNDVTPICGEAPEGYRIIACVRTLKDGTRIMAMPNPCNPAFMGESYAHIACHEAAHLKGWTRMHEE